MFGRKSKEPKLEGPYKVDVVWGKGSPEKRLNQRHAEGYDLVTILQNLHTGTNAGRDVVFKARTPPPNAPS